PVPGFDPILGLDRGVELRLQLRLVEAVVVHLSCHDHSTLGCALVRTCLGQRLPTSNRSDHRRTFGLGHPFTDHLFCIVATSVAHPSPRRNAAHNGTAPPTLCRSV